MKFLFLSSVGNMETQTLTTSEDLKFPLFFLKMTKKTYAYILVL